MLILIAEQLTSTFTAHARLMYRLEVTLQDAVVAVTVVECSMQVSMQWTAYRVSPKISSRAQSGHVGVLSNCVGMLSNQCACSPSMFNRLHLLVINSVSAVFSAFPSPSPSPSTPSSLPHWMKDLSIRVSLHLSISISCFNEYTAAFITASQILPCNNSVNFTNRAQHC